MYIVVEQIKDEFVNKQTENLTSPSNTLTLSHRQVPRTFQCQLMVAVLGQIDPSYEEYVNHNLVFRVSAETRFDGLDRFGWGSKNVGNLLCPYCVLIAIETVTGPYPGSAGSTHCQDLHVH